MMGTVVEEGTGKNASVKGYSIGGKTGTSEDGVNTGKYVTSFVGVSDHKNPDIVMVIILYNPTGEGGHQGGAVAAPIAGGLFREILPYLEVAKRESGELAVTVEMPDVTGLTSDEARKILRDVRT